MPRIMLIRHAEKHTNGGVDRSVNSQGRHAKHELTLRGWLRAGALAHFFAPAWGLPEDGPISTPRSIFASAATKDSPSLRPLHTVQPLAERIGVAVDTSFACGHEDAVSAAALRAPGPTLIVWHHSHIREICRAIMGPTTAIPVEWPEDRFDVVWVLDRSEDPRGPWSFTQVPQRLFAYDRDEPI
jgi:hypothetical protein